MCTVAFLHTKLNSILPNQVVAESEIINGKFLYGPHAAVGIALSRLPAGLVQYCSLRSDVYADPPVFLAALLSLGFFHFSLPFPAVSTFTFF